MSLIMHRQTHKNTILYVCVCVCFICMATCVKARVKQHAVSLLYFSLYLGSKDLTEIKRLVQQLPLYPYPESSVQSL